MGGWGLQRSEFENPPSVPLQDKVHERITEITDTVKYDHALVLVPGVLGKRYALFHGFIRGDRSPKPSGLFLYGNSSDKR